jgi:hypothetical protein
MIQIQPSATADTRTCDFSKVTKQTLLESSVQHIGDVREALGFFIATLLTASDIDGFHADFITGFKQTGWWDRHRMLNRHHLTQDDGIPANVNLIDVLDFIADCVMAGMARSGSVYPLKLSPELLGARVSEHRDALEVSSDGGTTRSRRRGSWDAGVSTSRPFAHERH